MSIWCHSPADAEENEPLKPFKDLNHTLQALKHHNASQAEHDHMHDSCKPGRGLLTPLSVQSLLLAQHVMAILPA